MSVRHFLLPLLTFTHPKGGDPVGVALVNRKRGMPAKAAAWEGALGLFGGLAEPGEDRMATLRREVWDDGDGSELPALPRDGKWGDPVEGFGGAYTITPYYVAAPWTQDLYRGLAATCG